MSRAPDYIVKAMRKDLDWKGKVGAAWRNEDGTISIAINAFTVIESDPELVVTLFPFEPKGGKGDKED